MSIMSMLQALLVCSFGNSVDQVPDRLAELEPYEAEPQAPSLAITCPGNSRRTQVFFYHLLGRREESPE